MKKILLLLAESFTTNGGRTNLLFNARLSKIKSHLDQAFITVDLDIYPQDKLPPEKIISQYTHIILFLDPHFDSLKGEISAVAETKPILALSYIDGSIDFKELGIEEHMDAANFSQDMEAMKEIILDFASK